MDQRQWYLIVRPTRKPTPAELKKGQPENQATVLLKEPLSGDEKWFPPGARDGLAAGARRMSQKQNRAEVAETRRLIAWYEACAADYKSAAAATEDKDKIYELVGLEDDAHRRAQQLRAQLRAAGLP